MFVRIGQGRHNHVIAPSVEPIAELRQGLRNDIRVVQHTPKGFGKQAVDFRFCFGLKGFLPQSGDVGINLAVFAVQITLVERQGKIPSVCYTEDAIRFADTDRFLSNANPKPIAVFPPTAVSVPTARRD